MNKLLLSLCAICALAAGLLGGCGSLAVPDMEEIPAGDRLIGVLITIEDLSEYIDEEPTTGTVTYSSLAEMQRELGRNISRQRVYASQHSEWITDEHSGRREEHFEYSFPGINGYYLFASTPVRLDTGEPVIGSTCEGISDVYFAVNTVGEGYEAGSIINTDMDMVEKKIGEGAIEPELSDVPVDTPAVDDTEPREYDSDAAPYYVDKITLEGTLYIAPGMSEAFHYNRVYQSADGQIYAVSGSSIGLGAYQKSIHPGEIELQDSGSVGALSYTDTSTTVVNGRERSYSCSVKVWVVLMPPPQKHVILQMDAENNILAQQEYAAGTVPESISLLTDAAYAIIETYAKDDKGEETVNRQLISRDESSFIVYVPQPSGVCIPQFVELEQPD